jgi:hypothetical protein
MNVSRSSGSSSAARYAPAGSQRFVTWLLENKRRHRIADSGPNISAPYITGDAIVGQTQVFHFGAWKPGTSVTHNLQWSDDHGATWNDAGSFADGDTVTWGSGDVGIRLRLQETDTISGTTVNGEATSDVVDGIPLHGLAYLGAGLAYLGQQLIFTP